MKVYLRILKFAKPYKFYVFISLISSILYVLTNGLSLWIIGSLLSSVMNKNSVVTTQLSSESFTDKVNSLIFSFIDGTNEISLLKYLSITLIISFALKNLFFYINNISLSYAQNGMLTNIRNQIFNKFQNLSLSFYKNRKTSVLTAIIIHDVNMLRMTFTQTVQNLFNQPLNVLFCLVMLTLINLKLALVSFIIIPISAYITIQLSASIRRKAKRSSKQIAALMNIVIENLSGIRIVKAFTREKSEIKKFDLEAKGLFKKQFKLDSLRFMSSPLNDMVGATIGAILLWIGGKQVLITHTLSGDGFIKFFTFLFAMFQPAKKLAGVNVEISRGVASAERVFKVLDSKETYNEKGKIELTEFNHNIEFREVTFAYNPKINVLNSINIKIKKNESIALVGASGAGKTTFADLIPRYYNVINGGIYIDNKNINDINVHSLRKKIGIVSQDSILFNESIYENIKYGDENATPEEIYNAADIANATEFINKCPQKYNTLVGEKGTKVSGGQKQRIAIARAVLKNPDILILDEATSALDSESEFKIKKAIDTISSNKTLIVIAHRLSTIKNADRILFFKDGQIIEQGNHKELYELNGEYRKLYNIQFDVK